MANVDPPDNFLDQFDRGIKWSNADGTLTPQARHFLENNFNFSTQIRNRTGGDGDSIDSNDIKELYSWQGLRDPEETNSLRSLPKFDPKTAENLTNVYNMQTRRDARLLELYLNRRQKPESVLSLYGLTLNRALLNKKAFSIVEIATGTTAYTTSGNEIIICNNTGALTIDFNPNPDEGEEVKVKRRDAAVTLDGNGNNIDGAGTQSLASQYDANVLIYTNHAAEWGGGF